MKASCGYCQGLALRSANSCVYWADWWKTHFVGRHKTSLAESREAVELPKTFGRDLLDGLRPS